MRISIHAPREECDHLHGLVEILVQKISIHAPREECDLEGDLMDADFMEFQSTHPVRSATRQRGLAGGSLPISIHAPREECDVLRPPRPKSSNYFNPRTP